MATTKVVIECKDRVEQVKSISFYRESQFFFVYYFSILIIEWPLFGH